MKGLKFGVFVCFSFACSGEGPSAGEPINELQDQLWYDTGGATAWPGGIVNVCFRANSLSAAARGQIQNALQKAGSWQQSANVAFTGFGICTTETPGASTVRISRNDNLGASVIGQATVGYRQVEQPTAEFKGDPLVGGDWIVMHEFGHVLNFAHETWDGSCGQRTSGGIQLSANDANASVMVYSSGCNGGPTVLSNQDRAGAQKVYGPWTVPCPNGADSTCEDINFNSASDLGLLQGSGYPSSSRYAMNGYGASFSTRATFLIHGGYWSVSFSGPKPVELPTDSASYDFTTFSVNQNIGCIAPNSTTQQDSIAMRDLQHGGGCDAVGSLGYAAQNFSRYVSTHYNRDPFSLNAWTSWSTRPNDSQPITMMATPSSGGTGWIDLIQVRVKYGRIDIWSDAGRSNGALGAAPDYRNIAPGTTNLNPPLWSATKVVFTAAGASPTAVTANVAAAGLDGVLIGQP